MRTPLMSLVAPVMVLAATMFAAGNASAGDVTVTLAESEEHGKYLADSEGKSLYLFEADEKGKSTCSDACAQAWPPLVTDGEPKAGESVDESLLDTIEREDGARQVTYNGWPLYYFVKDESPGDTQGQDVEGFGAEWYLVGADGKAVEEH